MSTTCASIPPLAPGSVTWDFISSLMGREPPIQRYELVPCVQMLFRAVAQVPVCLPTLSHLFFAYCLCRNQLATQCRQSLLCVVFLVCAWRRLKTFEKFPSYSRLREPRAHQVSSSFVMPRISFSLFRLRGPLLARKQLVCLPAAGSL